MRCQQGRELDRVVRGGSLLSKDQKGVRGQPYGCGGYPRQSEWLAQCAKVGACLACVKNSVEASADRRNQ